MTIRLLALVAVTGLLGCAGALETIRDANDIALDACELFATAHPVEARALVDRVDPAYSQRAAAAGDADAFDPRVLCVIPAVLDVFLLDQQGQVARLNRNATATSGGECAPPGGGPGAAAQAP